MMVIGRYCRHFECVFCVVVFECSAAFVICDINKNVPPSDLLGRLFAFVSEVFFRCLPVVVDGLGGLEVCVERFGG